jgi:serine/threonine-protein kinase
MTAPARIGRYELLESIGQGSLGVLYRARDTLLGREVAVKVMTPGFLGEEGAQERFFHEARAAARLQHVNIVTMFEFGEQDETPYIVMEFLRGFSLSQRLRKPPVMTLREKLDTAIQLCAGLDAAHRQGVVHRDVKPANIWMCLDGTVKLLDFGIATAASSTATILDNLSSPGYMSPEQIAGGDVDARTDIYSAGVVVYEMLTGQRPFEGDSPTGIMLKVVNEAAKPIADRELPPALTAAVARAMEKEPADRYARAADFGRDLKAIKASVTNQRDTATMVFDREALRKLTAAAPRPPAARTPNAKLQPAVSFGAVWLRSPLMIVLVAVVVLAAAIIGWCASRPAL